MGLLKLIEIHPTNARVDAPKKHKGWCGIGPADFGGVGVGHSPINSFVQGLNGPRSKTNGLTVEVSLWRWSSFQKLLDEHKLLPTPNLTMSRQFGMGRYLNQVGKGPLVDGV